MESSLHRSLKQLYAAAGGICEVPIGGFRADVVYQDQLIEIQHTPIASIRSKLRQLLDAGHRLVLVKPIVRRKKLVQLSAPHGVILYQRYSPRRACWWEVFTELVSLASLLNNSRLIVEIVECDIEEWRCPARRPRRRPWQRRYRLLDQRLLAVHQSRRLATPADYRALLPQDLPEPFDSTNLASLLNIPRWLSQKVLYVLRHVGAVHCVAKRGNSRLYRAA